MEPNSPPSGLPSFYTQNPGSYSPLNEGDKAFIPFSVAQIATTQFKDLIEALISPEDNFDSLTEEDPKEGIYKTIQERAARELSASQKDDFFFHLSQIPGLDYTYLKQSAEAIKDPTLKDNAFLSISTNPKVHIVERQQALKYIQDTLTKDQALLGLCKAAKVNLNTRIQLAKAIHHPKTRDQVLLDFIENINLGLENTKIVIAAMHADELRDQAYLNLCQSQELAYVEQPITLTELIQSPKIRDTALLSMARNAFIPIFHRFKAIEQLQSGTDKNLAYFEISQSSQFCMEERLKAATLLSDPVLKSICLTPCQHLRYKEDFYKPWLDLRPSACYFSQLDLASFKETPYASFVETLPLLSNEDSYTGLKEEINAYHSLAKTDERALTGRIKALKAIARVAASYIQNNREFYALQPSDKQCLQAIIVRANLKSHYLTQLSSLKADAQNRSALLLDKNSNHSAVLPPTLDALQSLDPAKREGLVLLRKDWKQTLSTSTQPPNFWLWLEGQDTTHLHSDLRHSFISKKLKKITFIRGLAYNEIFRNFGPQSKGLIEDGSYLYTISQEGHLYILPSDGNRKQFLENSKVLFTPPLRDPIEVAKLQNNRLTHDTILQGENVVCAGIVSFKNGKIVVIDNNSGHYVPDLYHHLHPALSLLLKQNPDAIDDTATIRHYENGVHYAYLEFKHIAYPDKSLKSNAPTVSMEDLGFYKPVHP